MHIDIVIPVYKEAKNLPALLQRLDEVTATLPDFSWAYIFVNDGSPDDTLDVLTQLAQKKQAVKVIDFSRNFGKEIALTAGVHASDADAVICMDADLQHPPELIPKLVQSWQEGAEIVATVRVTIDKQPALRRMGSYLFYKIMGSLSGINMVSHNTDFRLFDKRVVQAFRQVTERNRIFRGIMDWMGFRTTYIEFHADARHEGDASYSYAGLWRLAINSITSFSLFPLRIAGYLGLAITTISGVLLSWMLIEKLVIQSELFTPLAIVVVANTFLIGIVLMAIGLVALYIGTIHTEVINRPLYIVRQRLNFKDTRSD